MAAMRPSRFSATVSSTDTDIDRHTYREIYICTNVYTPTEIYPGTQITVDCLHH